MTKQIHDFGYTLARSNSTVQVKNDINDESLGANTNMPKLTTTIIVRLYIISCTSSMSMIHVSSLSELNLVQTLNR